MPLIEMVVQIVLLYPHYTFNLTAFFKDIQK